MSVPTLSVIKKFSRKYDSFPEGGMRHRVFHEGTNGMKDAGVVIRIGRKVLIHEERFFLLEEIKNTGEYDIVIKLIKDAKIKGKYLPLEAAVAMVRGGEK